MKKRKKRSRGEDKPEVAPVEGMPSDLVQEDENESESPLSIEPDEILPSIEDEKPQVVTWAEEEVPESHDIVRYDALSAYLREIGRYPALSRQDEYQLAIRYYKDRDIEAAYKLILSNLWVVVQVARDYEAAARTLLDLIQEGNMGLMEAVKNFDPYKEVRFPSYAVWWIRAYIIRFVIANWRLVKIGTTQAQRKLFFNLNKEKERLEREGFRPAPKLIADRLNVRESDVIEMEQRLGGSELSFDAPIQEDSDANLGSVIPAETLSAEDLLSKKQTKEMIRNSLEAFAGTLNKKENVIFQERILGEEKATLQELAEKFSLSKERVRQIENRIKEKLKVFLVDKLGPNIDGLDFDE